jgi:hypothetical protein
MPFGPEFDDTYKVGIKEVAASDIPPDRVI